MGEHPPADARMLFSVERFDYTKGITEKLRAFKRYFEKYPERIGKDTLCQVAVTNRRSVESYRVYQVTTMDPRLSVARQMLQNFHLKFELIFMCEEKS